jgi:hypothetical protein
MLVSFPSDLCTEGGRRPNNRLPGWPDTLPGGARNHSSASGATRCGQRLGFSARVLTCRPGMPRDADACVTVAQSAA